MNTPQNLFYTKSDEWIRQEEDGTFTIGITDYAQSELGEIVYIELPEVGADLAEGAPFGVIESVKSVSELHLPAAGKVVKINEAVAESPAIANESPYENGWLIRIQPTDPSKLKNFLNATDYARQRS